MQHIVICSEEMLFADALSAIVSGELAAKISHITTPDQLPTLVNAPIDLVIAHEPLSSFTGRVCLFPMGAPRKISSILGEVRLLLAQKNLTKHAITDEIMLDTSSRILEHEKTGDRQELTEKEQALLLFVRDKSEASREEILSAVWGFAKGIDTHTLETHLYRLRGKWRELANFDCIAATDKGYRWYE